MLILTCFMAASLGAADAPVDQQAVKDVFNQLTAAWNSRDAEAMAALFAEDADYINSRGVKLAGRKQIQEYTSQQFKLPAFSQSKHKRTAIRVRILSSDCAIADSSWELTGLIGTDGQALPTRAGDSTMVVMKKDGRWLIVALRSMVPAKD